MTQSQAFQFNLQSFLLGVAVTGSILAVAVSAALKYARTGGGR